MTKEELTEILNKHEKWLFHGSGVAEANRRGMSYGQYMAWRRDNE